MAGFAHSMIVVLLLFSCNVSLIQGRPGENTKVLNHADVTRYPDCTSLLKAGYNISGVYRLTFNNTDIRISCEFIDGNAFTVILRRLSNNISFIQTWTTYENGFGNPEDNYWSGLAYIYFLTLQGNNNLQIYMEDWYGNGHTVLYSDFYLEDSSTRYRLHVGEYQGTLPDELSYHNNMPFSTFDAPDPEGCAAGMKTGWWYNHCAYTLPTGIYYTGGWYTPSGTMYDGIFWKDWYGYNYSLQYISMTIYSDDSMT